MKLKVLKIDNGAEPIRRNTNKIDDLIQRRVVKEESFESENYFVYSTLLSISGVDLGVRQLNKNGEFKSLPDYLSDEGLELLKLRFIVVDLIGKKIYYDGDQNDVKSLLFNLFNIKSTQILQVVSVEDLKRLKKLKIKTYTTGQTSINDSYGDHFFKEMEILNSVGDLEYTTYEMVMKQEGARLNRDKFNDLINKSNKNLIEVTASGFDENGHEVTLSSSISKKIEVLTDYNSWESKLDLEFITILESVKKEVGNE